MVAKLHAQRLYIAIAAALVVACTGYLWLSTKAAVPTADEIHYSYLENEDGVVFNWRGTEDTIYYGIEREYAEGENQYPEQAVAARSAITPLDNAGPFYEVKLPGLQKNATYHYKIGIEGQRHTFKTVPTASFTWVDIGDSASSYCNPWMPLQHQLIAVQNPHFVTHGGDISEANNCSMKAINSYYTDQEVWSRSAAFQPAWGNHEYANPTAKAEPGTPRDSMANYKGRSYMTNAQTVAQDTEKRVTHPGCGQESGSLTNTCRGEDWGWFKAGHVLFISYPEPDTTNVYAEWQPQADALMAQAQANPEIDFIITYGHRPAWTSVSGGPEQSLQVALNALATKYSPRSDNIDGKYVLNVGHHKHGEEVFSPQNGLTEINNAAGGQGLTAFSSPPAANSVFRMQHLGIMRGDYDAANHTLTMRIVCGAEMNTVKDPCTYGNTMHTVTFTKGVPGTNPGPVEPVTKEWVGNSSVETNDAGWTGRYGASTYVTVGRVTGTARTGAASMKVTAKTGAKALSSGFNDSPRWQTNTVAGTTYTGTVWIKPSATNQQVTLRLREWQGSTSVTDKSVTLTATSTDWQKISVPITAAQSGNQLAFAVYGKSMNAGQYFFADDMSITSVQ